MFEHSPVMAVSCRASGGVDVLSSGSLGQPEAGGISGVVGSGSWLEGGGQGLHNPLAWDNMPSALREKFPHWKEEASSAPKSNASGSDEGIQLASSWVYGVLAYCVCGCVNESDQAYSCYKTTYKNKQQPDYTFPYVVSSGGTRADLVECTVPSVAGGARTLYPLARPNRMYCTPCG